jgi:hypothetical protein
VRLALVLALIVGLPSPSLAQAQREERAVGGQRLCRYTAARIVGPRQRERVAAVGRGEPCPATFPRPSGRPQPIPSLATLSGQERRGARVICRYAYAGRNYSVERGSGTCPLTPSIF